MEERFFIKKQLVVVPFGKRFHAVNSETSELLFVHRFYKGASDEEESWREDFEAWVEVLSEMDLNSIPKLITKGEDEDGIYVVLSRVKGVGLADLVKGGHMTVGPVRDFAAQLLEVCRLGRDKGIIHGALDPRRITVGIDDEGRQLYSVDDFGLPFIHGQIQRKNAFMGLAPFVSLVQARGEAQDEAGELFSISQFLLYCLAGGHPYSSNQLAEIGAAYEAGNIPQFEEVSPNLPEDFLAWLNQLAGENGVSGFATFEEALEQLPEVDAGPVIDVERIQIEIEEEQKLKATAAVGSATQTKLITGTVGVTPAHQQTTGVQLGVPQTVAGLVGQPQDSGKKIKMGIIAAGVVFIGLIWFLVAGSGGDESESDRDKVVEDKSELQKSSIPMKGLVAAWNFDGSLESSKDDGKSFEALEEEGYEAGKNGQGLVVGRGAYFSAKMDNEENVFKLKESTLSFWFKVPEVWKGYGSVIGNKAVGPHTEGWLFILLPEGDDSWRLSWSVGDGLSLWSKQDKEMVATPGEWIMVTVVKKGRKMWDVYKNGKLSSSSDWSDLGDLADDGKIFLGADSTLKHNLTNKSVIDQVYIWDRALSSSEINKIYSEDLRFIKGVKEEDLDF